MDANFHLKNRLCMRNKNKKNAALYSGLGYQVPTDDYHKHLKNYINEKDVRLLLFIYSIFGPDNSFRSVHASHLQLSCRRIHACQRAYDVWGWRGVFASGTSWFGHSDLEIFWRENSMYHELWLIHSESNLAWSGMLIWTIFFGHQSSLHISKKLLYHTMSDASTKSIWRRDT